MTAVPKVQYSAETFGAVPAPPMDGVLCVHARVSPASVDTRLLSMLSDEERGRASRFRFEDDRRAYILAHVLKRRLLARASGRAPSELRFSTAPGGKPVLVDLPFRFNLSHTRGWVALAISAVHEVGVDVETVRELDLQTLMPSVLDTDARAEVEADASPSEAFLTLWTLKEAVVKAWGAGLSIPLPELNARPLAGGWTSVGHAGRLAVAHTCSLADAKLAIAIASDSPAPLNYHGLGSADFPGADFDQAQIPTAR